MTVAIYEAVEQKVEEARQAGRRCSTSGMLKHLGVSRSGYRAWQHRNPSVTKQREERVKKRIKEIYAASHKNYGAPNIAKSLRKEGETISERTVGKYMRDLGIRAQWVPPFTVTTKDQDFSPCLQNILDENFNPERPNTAWCSDITYIWTSEGFVYLTSIMDLFSRKIIAWILSETLSAEHVVEAVKLAKKRRPTDNPTILHSDRGCQYVSAEYRKITKGMQLSYSKKAYPWDNACIESFHALIKREWLKRFRIKDFNHAYRLVFEYIETFYNTVRIHGHCGDLSPNEFEAVYKDSHLSDKEN